MDTIRKIVREVLVEAYIDKHGNLQDFANELVDFDSFPPDILKTLENEYDIYSMKFDWNEKTSEMGQGPEFRAWFEENKSREFLKNLDKLITYTTQDMILLKKQEIAKQKLEAYEELLIDGLGSDILAPALSRFEVAALWDPNATPQSIEKARKDAKHIIDKEGNIDSSKLEKSTLFGDMITYASFEKYVERHPEYKKAFDIWYKLFMDEIDLSMKPMHAFRSSTSIDRIRKLRNFLINFKKEHKFSAD